MDFDIELDGFRPILIWSKHDHWPFTSYVNEIFSYLRLLGNDKEFLSEKYLHWSSEKFFEYFTIDFLPIIGHL